MHKPPYYHRSRLIQKARINLSQTLRNLHAAMRHHNEKYPDDLKEQVRESMKYTAEKIYLDFVKKFAKGQTREGKLRTTHQYFAGEGCLKTAYNHILRLIKAGIVRKSRAVMNFGRGSVNCIELKLDENILEIEVEDKFLTDPPSAPVRIPKLDLSNEKRRLSKTVLLADLLNSLTYKT